MSPFTLVFRPSAFRALRPCALVLLLGTVAALGVALPSSLAAQADGTGWVEGRVRDAEGRPLRGITVMALAPGEEEEVLRITQSDETGYFRLVRLSPGDVEIRVLRIGYRTWEERVIVRPDEATRLEVVLETAAVALEGIAVEGERSRARARFEGEAGITVREISREEIRRLPGLAEADPVRAIEVLPGVISPTDFSASFNVRGGSADQNLILLDGFPLFNPFHLGGIFSVFSADMVDRVELQSGGFPAEFGGRVSSVLRVETDPGSGQFQVDGGISLLAARLALAGSLPEGFKSATGLSSARWRVSGRRSYVDQLARPFFEIPYHIADLQGVFEGWTEGGSRWTLSAYRGEDVLDLGRLEVEDFPLRAYWEWGNSMAGARWLRAFPGGGSLEAAAGLTRFGTELRFEDFDDSLFRSQVDQWTLRASGRMHAGRGWTFRGGVAADHYNWDNLAETGGTRFSDEQDRGWNPAAFLQGEWALPGRWLVEGGLRLEGWVPREGEGVQVPAPRFAAKRFFADGEAAVRVSAGRYAQFVHSVRDEELPLGLDVWVTTGAYIPHVVSDQLQVGVERFLGEGWTVALDGYLREFEGVITNNLASDPNDPSDLYLPGQGRSRGVDLFVEREGDGVAGTLAVSWLQATRTFPDFVSGRVDRPPVRYPPIFDRRMDVDLNLRFPLPRGWEGGARWHVGTGLPHTRPLAGFAFLGPRQTQGGRVGWQGIEGAGDEGEEGPQAVLLGPRNGARYPAYHRLDLSARRTFQRPWGRITPYVSVLNVYNQGNVLFYFYELDKTPAIRSGLSMFPFLPTVGVDVRFR